MPQRQPTEGRVSAKELAALVEPLRVRPGAHVDLPKDHDPAYKAGWLDKQEGEAHLQAGVELLAAYQERLAAQDTHAVVLVLQALDAGGKDGTIRHVMSGVNPQGVVVHSFKVPSEEELCHDFLWRYQRHLPARGQIGIFNRSHYEEVLVVRVHPELLERQHLPAAATHGELWQRRYREINDWERYLVDNGFRVVKALLNISRAEQRRRFLARIEVPQKNWKFSAADIAERAHWDDYQRAFSDMLTHTSTEWAPWYVIPADHKWFAHIAVGALLARTLLDIDPQYPRVDAQARAALAQAGEQLAAEGSA
ncbi:MAG TPA: polyphosphate kinase 2 family protein [Solirubrobacteraceae bacterium]|nr:polyphosphate kinase 2 family protein [Solirubrobacteraceae bacterium]